METSLRNAFRNTSSTPTTPSAPLRWLRIFFLMAQPPLLYQEGNCQPDIHSQLRRPREQKGWCSLHLTFLLLHRVLQHQCVGDDLFAWLYPRNDFLHVSGQHVSSDDFDTFERSVLCCVNPLAIVQVQDRRCGNDGALLEILAMKGGGHKHTEAKHAGVVELQPDLRSTKVRIQDRRNVADSRFQDSVGVSVQADISVFADIYLG